MYSRVGLILWIKLLIPKLTFILITKETSWLGGDGAHP